MNERARFIRKIAYASAIAALLLPLSFLSQPATMRGDGSQSEGGVLAQMRERHQLSQATLGEIDPASETIKLATLGMRGVAANILWEKAHEYKKREDWVGFKATLEQIARLQPNFVSVWVYQGWNLSYNISVEFDDYRDRYYWVIKGIEYLQEGTKYNDREPRLLSEIGWTIAHKIGTADEHVQFRRLFREDDDFNATIPRAQRDNWLVGRKWMLDAERLVDQEGVPIRGKSPLLFHFHPAKFLIDYAEAMEEEGTFGEVAKNAWKNAADSWRQFSNRDLPTQYNLLVRLADKETFDKQSEQAQAELAKLIPPQARDELLAEKMKTLSEDERDAHDIPAQQRTREQRELVMLSEDKLKIAHVELAERVPEDKRALALKLAEEATYADFVSNAIGNERDIVNYDYWLRRCQIEPQDNTLEARKMVYDADLEFLAADLVKSRQLYSDGLAKWRRVLDEYPILLKDPSLVDELVESIEHYRSVLHQLDEGFPQPFILQDVLDASEKFTGKPFSADVRSEAEAADPANREAPPPSDAPTETPAAPPDEPATPEK
jgi:hypothetical protein